MNNRTLVKVTAYENCISIKTVSRERKSPQRFFIGLDNLAQLEVQSGIIVKDINSFAALRRDVAADTLEINFTWLRGTGSVVSGYEETSCCHTAALRPSCGTAPLQEGPRNGRCSR